MASIFTGVQTLSHWLRARRAAAHAAQPVDRSHIEGALTGIRPDLASLRATVVHDGVAAIPGYWSHEQCAQGRAEINRLISLYPEAVQNHSGGSDKRMFGVESASDHLMSFHADSFARLFGELLCGLDIYNFATLGARIEATAGNRGSGDGWHRDAAGFQFKAILYLCDTDLSNGPFQYLVGSHTTLMATTDAMMTELPDPYSTRFTDETVEKIVSRGIEKRTFTAKEGTLLLVNTAGIHRGMPLKSGIRYALTNYYYHRYEVGEERIQKFSPLVPGTAERVRRDTMP